MNIIGKYSREDFACREVTINGRLAKRTNDNFFVLNEKVRTPTTVAVVDMNGRHFVRKMGEVRNGVDFQGYM